MIQLNELKDMLDVDEKEVEALDDDQLKLLLGCLNYASRIATREINRREEGQT